MTWMRLLYFRASKLSNAKAFYKLIDMISEQLSATMYVELLFV